MRSIAPALLAALILVAGLSVTAGCHADPHDTHIAAPVITPR